ncbi:GFA family protein [Xanthomonas populi]|uniref:Aldehyde-activating protein n=1 Tax=Xanthomonas populi TaxID=53414 RepID=A0A2S7EN96_9XANT|nr:aldehyde-activating protein [Xanthomonas populi]PPU92695.1 aldehyde-activating protein [Xanthomonas populi]
MHYAGGCHCGPIAFDLETDAPITAAHDCTCALRQRDGGLPWFCRRTQLRLHGESAALGLYRFNQQHIDHQHRPQCGISPFSGCVNPKTGEAGVSVNVRCLPQLDLAALRVHALDGASR